MVLYVQGRASYNQESVMVWGSTSPLRWPYKCQNVSVTDSCASHLGVKDRVGAVVGEVFASDVEPDDDERMEVMVVRGRKRRREN
jgi:hypothetical protein